MDLFSKSEHNQFTLVCSSLRNFFKRWWLTNQLWVSWTALAAPLCVAMAFETTFRLPRSIALSNGRGTGDCD